MSFRQLAMIYCLLLIATTSFAQERPVRNPGLPPVKPAAAGTPSLALLPRIKIQTQTRRGRARMSKGKLYLNMEKNASQVVLTAPAPAEYDLTFKGVRSLGEGSLIVGFVMDGHALHFVANEHRDGKIVTGLRTLVNNKVTYPGGVDGSQFKTGRPFVLTVHVRQGEVAATLDGRKLFYWRGRGGDPYPNGSGFYKIKEDPSFSIGSWNAKFDFDEINLKPVRNAGALAWNLNKKPPAAPNPAPAVAKTDTPQPSPVPMESPENMTPQVEPVEEVNAGLKPQRAFAIETKNYATFAIAPSSRYVAATIYDNKVTIFDTATGKPHKTLETGGGIESLVFAKARRGGAPQHLYLGQRANIQKWDIARSKRMVDERLPTPIDSIRYASKYDILFASASTYHSMYMLRVQSPLSMVGNAVVFGAFAVSPDESVLAAAGYSRELFIHDVWDKQNNRPNGHMRYKLSDLPAVVTAIGFGRDSKLLAAGFKDGLIRIYNVATKEIVASFKTGMPVGNVVFSSDAKQLAVSNKGLAVYDIAKGTVVKEIVSPEWNVRRMEAGTNHRILAGLVESPEKKKTLKLWSMSQIFMGEPAADSSSPAAPSTGASAFRTWRTADGKYEIVAAFVRLTGGVVYLKRKADGAVIPVKKELLSRPDLAWVRTQSR